MLRLFTIIWLVCAALVGSSQTFGQQNLTTLIVSAIDSNGQAVIPSSIVVRNAQTGLILAMKGNIVADTTVISFSQKSCCDTALLALKSPGFADWTKRMLLESNSDTLTIVAKLTRTNSTLPEAVVMAPKTWIRGDTTFYRTSAYAQGDERKLKDILAKLPDFRIKEDGSLLYKNKLVEKITVDGEELFADRIRLLLDNFPVHVLDQVQAIEHQSNNRLLSGISPEDRTFVNLSLKDKHIQAAFGDGTAALSTNLRYTASPVLFALKQKLRMAVIGNYNNLGTGFDWRIRDEGDKVMQGTDAGLELRPLGILVVNNFPSERYVNNRLFDTKLQINTSIRRSIQSKTQFSFTTDRQSQRTFSNMRLIHDSSTFSRVDTNLYQSKPRTLIMSQELYSALSGNKSISAKIKYYSTISRSDQLTKYLMVGSADSMIAQQDLNGKALYSEYTFTNRRSDKKAFIAEMEFSYHNMPQKGLGFSNSYARIFQVGNSFDWLKHDLRNSATKWNGGVRWLVKKRDFTNNIAVQFQFEDVLFTNRTSLSQANNIYVDSILSLLVNFFQVKNKTLSVGYSRPFTLGRWFLNLKANSGVQHSNQSEQNTINERTFYIGDLSLTAKRTVTKASILEGQMLFTAEPFSNTWRTGQMRPYSINSFISLKNLYQTNHYSEARAIYSYSFTSKISANVQVSATSNYRSVASYNNWQSFAQLQIDSITRRGTTKYNGAFGINYLNPSKRLQIALQSTVYGGQQLYQTATAFGEGKIRHSSVLLFLNKSWHRGHYIQISADYASNQFILPSAIKGKSLPQVYQSTVNVTGYAVVTSKIQVKASSFLFANNISSSNQSVLFFGDLDFIYKPLQKPFYFTATVQNVSNQSSYESINNQPGMQQFFAMPLVGRNLMFKAVYEF